MNRSFRKRFEEGLKAISTSLTKKNGTKKYEAVLRRIGKLEGHFPSISASDPYTTRRMTARTPTCSSDCSHTR